MRRVKYFFGLKRYIYWKYRTIFYRQKLQNLLQVFLTWIWHCTKYHTPPWGFIYSMWVHVPLVEYCCPKLIWNENTILWCGWEPGAYSTLNLNYGMIQRLTASRFVALQSSSCLSRIQPVNPQSPCSQQVLLLPTLLEDQPWIPNLQPKLQTAVPVVNLLASHPQKLTRVNWRLSCARNQHTQHTVLMPTGWKAKEMPDIILSYCSNLNDRILESRKAWYKTWQYRLGCFGLCNKSSLLTQP